MSRFILSKLSQRHILQRIVRERLSEPVWANLASIPVALFGSFRQRVEFDLVVRMHHAWGILHAADSARRVGVEEILCVEFGVAAGAGLLNMCEIAKEVTRETGVGIQIVGFDTGRGMPPPVDYRDHPEHYRRGDYPMTDEALLRSALPSYASLELGPLAETVRSYFDRPRPPIGFVSLDVDYHSSTSEALVVCALPANTLLPRVVLYVDDIKFLDHNPYQGALLAIREFNECHDKRKITKMEWLDNYRLFRRAEWLRCMHQLHVFDHPFFVKALTVEGSARLTNPYLGV